MPQGHTNNTYLKIHIEKEAMHTGDEKDEMPNPLEEMRKLKEILIDKDKAKSIK